MVLQTTYKNGLKDFTSIGEDFQIAHKDDCPEEFERAARVEQFDPLALERVFAFVTHAGGSQITPLFNDRRHVILNDKGEVFMDFKGEKVVRTVEKPKLPPVFQDIVQKHLGVES